MSSTIAKNGSIKPLPSRSQNGRPHPRSRPRHHAHKRGVLSTMTHWLVNNQIRMPLTVLSAVGTLHMLFPQQPYTAKFFFLSHFNPDTNLYNKGPGDWPFVITWVLYFTLLRAVLMRFVFQPFFHHFAPHPTRHTATRFAEQAWSVWYCSASFAIGLWIVLKSPYWGDLSEMWAEYPQIESPGFFKGYYLVEMAFWLQQVFVLNIEARRKDFWQMLAHHLITCTLIFMSYTYNVTWVGNAILCVMDFSDILLSAAKMLKYLELQRLCDGTFFLFLVSWPYTRHYLFLRMLFSAFYDAPRIFHRDNRNSPTYQTIPRRGGGTWAPGYNWNPSQGYYFTYEVHMAFIALLATLQCILLLWFVMIIRLAVRVIRGSHAEDDRSEDEDDGEEEGEEEEEEEEEETEVDVKSLSVANGNIPGSSTANGIAFSNGIHQRKMAG